MGPRTHLPPPDTSYYVLIDLRDHILECLRFLPHDFTLDDGDDRDREIQRAADRLKKIAHITISSPPAQQAAPERRPQRKRKTEKARQPQ